MDSEEKVVVPQNEQDQELELNLDSGEDIEAIKTQLAEANKKLEQFNNVVARAKAAEAKLKTQTEAPQINNNSLSEESVDVKILESQGTTEEAITYLKKLAKVNGTSVLAAQQDEIYKTWKSNKDAEVKAQKAQLGASRGSGQGKVEKSTTTPHLSDEEHKELWLKSQGR